MKVKDFSQEELQEMESLQILGGRAIGGADPLAQTECINNSIGCGGGDADQTKCVNAIKGCGLKVQFQCKCNLQPGAACVDVDCPGVIQ